MKTKQELQEHICKLISDIAPDADFEDLEVEEDLRDELDLDSIDFMNLTEAIATELSVNIPESDYPKVRTMEDMVNYIAEQTAQ